MICDTRGGIVEVLPLTLASRRLLRQPKDLGKLNGCSLGAACFGCFRSPYPKGTAILEAGSAAWQRCDVSA